MVLLVSPLIFTIILKVIALTTSLDLISIGGFKLSTLRTIVHNYNPNKIISGLSSGRNFFDDVTVRHTKSNLVTPSISQAKHYAHFAAAAQCNERRLDLWNCKDCLAVGASVRFYAQFNNRTTKNRAFISIDHKLKEIILAYRGAGNVRNSLQVWTMDLIPVPVPGENGKIEVHRGAWSDLMSLHVQVTNALRILHSKYPNHNVIITGQSLGGMLASLALLKLKTTPEFSNISYSLYTYGQPRTGNMEFALWINSQNIPAVRVVSNGDIIPHFTQSSVGYVHHLRELWINGNRHRFCSEEMFEDPSCSNSIGPHYSFMDYLIYFDTSFPPFDCVIRHPFTYIRSVI